MGWLVNNAMNWRKQNRNKHYNTNNYMAINATKKEKKERELLPADNYMARCCKIVHIGTSEFEKNGSTYELNKAVLFFEILGSEGPFIADREVVLNTAKDSDFRKLLNGWRGQDLTDEEADSFDITVLLDKPCMVNIGHKTIRWDGGSFETEEVLGISKKPGTMTFPAGKIAPVILDYDNWSKEVFDGLPQRYKKKITNSKEYKALFAS